MYFYDRSRSGRDPFAQGLSRPDAAGLADSIVAEEPGTNRKCRADERRIHHIVEPGQTDLVRVAKQHLADPAQIRMLHRAAYDAYARMKAAAEADGIPANLLTIVSGYRSVAHQKRLWADALKKYGSPKAARRWVAPPGGSPHHTGRAIDFWLGRKNSSGNVPALRTTVAYKWLVCNAARFGFTPYAHEPWHWEYNPPEFTPGAVPPSPRPRKAPTHKAPSPVPEVQLLWNALRRGIRDVARLTNMIFHARHPEIGGRRLEPGERELAREWIEIRDRLVRPALAGTGSLGEFAESPHRLSPEDVNSEMVGRHFRLASGFSSGPVSLSAGSTVEVVDWPNASNTVRARTAALPPFNIPKILLRPIIPAAAGMAPYSANLGQVVSHAQRGAQAIANWQAKRPQFSSPAAQQRFARELARLEGLQRNRERLLNKRLIQETMFNRFDPIIRQWTNHYNVQFRLSGTNALDPNLVKALLYQESRMGTSGQHLEVPPSHPVKSRFNLGQVIDSSAAALLIMMQEMQPALLTAHHLQNINADLARARRELATLKSIARPTPAQQARRAELTRLSKQSWEVFLWQYKASGRASGFADAVRDFFAGVPAGQPARNMDYEFWIRAAIRWLFQKHTSGRSWPNTVRAYNGSGPRADRYRNEVVQRAADALAAQRAGREFIPADLRP
jgi:hypothetical protein